MIDTSTILIEMVEVQIKNVVDNRKDYIIWGCGRVHKWKSVLPPYPLPMQISVAKNSFT